MMQAEEWSFKEGDELAEGRHALVKLGGGHRYEAYLAWDERLLSIVVVKVLRPHLVTNIRALEGLRGEAAMLRGLAHPVILRCFDSVLEGPRPHVVLEHLEGPRLSTLVRKHGSLPPEQLLPLALQVCSAVHYLALEHICHLDIKPANIIMSGPPRVIDLSIARSFEQAASNGRGVGTDDYMSPEQCDPDRFGAVGPAADIWGLGATLYEAATGLLPFDRRGTDDRSPAEYQEVRPFARAVPHALASPILACLDKDQANRPTATELYAALEPLSAQLPKPVLGRLKPKLG